MQSGELNYAWSYVSIAKTAGMRHVDLPPELDLSDPHLASWYAQATVRVPGADRSAADSVEFPGEPIVYALTIPTAAPHPATALAFIRFLLSDEGRSILPADGLTVMSEPVIGGPGKPPAGVGR